MATSTVANLQNYAAQFQIGLVETVETEIQVFNQNSAGGMVIRSNNHRGDTLEEAFFDADSGLSSHRDPTSTGSVTPGGLSQSEFVSPKVNKRLGPKAFTNDSLRKIGMDPATGLMVLGEKQGPRILEQYRESAVSALIGAASDSTVSSNLVLDATNGSLDTSDLIKGTSMIGDAFNRIQAWVMHSKTFFDLVQNQVDANIDGVSSFNLFRGMPATLNKPVLVTDSPALFAAGSGTTSSNDDVYYTFGLTEGALEIIESQDRDFLVTQNTGENIVTEWQLDYAYTVSVKGMQYTGTSNPNDSTLATGSNWSQAAADKRNLFGIAVKSR